MEKAVALNMVVGEELERPAGARAGGYEGLLALTARLHWPDLG